MNHQDAYLRAALLACMGDREQYRKVCRGMVERFSTADALARENLIKACCLGEDLPVEKSSFQKLVDQNGDAGPAKRLILGLANYRIGRFNLAAEQLRGVSLSSEDQPTIRATARLFLAMSLHQLGRADESLAEFDAARRMVHEAVPIAEVEDLDAVGLEDWLTCQTAWRQAEAFFERK